MRIFISVNIDGKLAQYSVYTFSTIVKYSLSDFFSEEELYFWECHKMFREDDQRIFLQISKPLANNALFSHVSQRQDVCEMFLL